MKMKSLSNTILWKRFRQKSEQNREEKCRDLKEKPTEKKSSWKWAFVQNMISTTDSDTL
jgi:hypothetical protein